MTTEIPFEKLAAFADKMGRKIAHAGGVPVPEDPVVTAMREELTKIAAFNPRALGVGAGIGAVGGALSGLQKDQQGQTHVLRNALGGAALGGAAGAAAGHVGTPKVPAAPVHPPVQPTLGASTVRGRTVPMNAHPTPHPTMPQVDYDSLHNQVSQHNQQAMASLSHEAHSALDNHPAVKAGLPKEMALRLISMSGKPGADLDHSVKMMAGSPALSQRLRQNASAATVASPMLQKAAEEKKQGPNLLGAALKATAAMTLGGGLGYAGGKLLGKGLGTLIKKTTGHEPTSVNVAPYLAAGTALLGGALMAVESARDKHFKEVFHDAYQRSEKQRRSGNVGK